MRSLQWLDPDTLARLLGTSWDDLCRLAGDPASCYHQREIRAGKKRRTLLLPNRHLKAIQ